MIVIDTSALIAILNYEPERTAFYDVIAAADRRLVGAVTYQEAGQVLISKRGVNGLYDLEDFLALIKAEIIPHDVSLAAMSLEAFRRYGKGIDPKGTVELLRLRGLRARQGDERAAVIQGKRLHRDRFAGRRIK